jgi:hypothetical protein
MNSYTEYPIPARPISAVDAIAPAFRRMKSILAGPFRLGFFLKICLFVALCDTGFISATFSYPVQGANAAMSGANGIHHGGNFLARGMPGLGTISAGILLLLAVLALIGIAFWIACTYAFCRLRFTVLDLAIYREGGIRRAWRKYGPQAWRYFGLTILVGLVFLLLMAAVIGPFIPAFIRVSRTMDPAHPNPFALLQLMFPLFLGILFLSLLGMVIDAMIRDFMLPPMAIEDAPIESALRRFFGLLRSDFGSMLLYVFMRIVLSIAITACLAIVCLIPVGLLGLLAFVVGLPLYYSLWQGGAQMLFAIYVAVAGTVVLSLYFLSLITIYGVNGVFKLCYAVIFYGARYPELGSRLEPGSGQQAAREETLPPAPQAPGMLPVIEPPPVW